MPRATTAFATAVALFLPIGRPLLVGLTPAAGIGAGLLSTQKAYAQSAQDWLESAFKKYNNGDYQGAIDDLTKVIEINPQLARVYVHRGDLKKHLDKNSDALIDFNKAIELEPDYAYAYFLRAIVKSNLKDYQGAIADFDKVIGIDPLASNYIMRGLTREDMGDLQGACSDWRKAAELGDEDAAELIRDQC
jgi:tetratricopeptide (TPR) repeat protein